jgi:Ca2+-binding EF-hand superfamily protein
MENQEKIQSEEIRSMLKVLPNEAGAINEEDLKEIFKQND